ncbi:MAG: DUF1549 and DUF1553 domain-containing protein [Planctomycetaceae bacterium]
MFSKASSLALYCVVLLLAGACGFGGRARAGETVPNVDPASSLAAQIDALIAARWAAEGVEPAPLADDATFLRRVWLDVGGKIPTVADLHEFLANAEPDRRRQVVDRLLDGPGYVAFFASTWRRVMLPEAESNLELRGLVPPFEAWLRRHLVDNTPYDRIVRELLMVELDQRNAREGEPLPVDLTPVSFYQAKELKPENLAAGTARMFLGVRIECAQCHDHPFDNWKREQFWSFAAFFGGLERGDAGGNGPGAIREAFERREIEIPGTGRRVAPAYLTGQAPSLERDETARRSLAEWVTRADNPYFTKTAVNRFWGHFFGLGIVDPVDDFTADNRPSHPELIELLAREFAARDFDLKFLIRAITSTRAYQLDSRQTHPRQDDLRLFARMPLKALSPTQIFDSIAQATGFYEPYSNRNAPVARPNSPRDEFLQMFDNSSDSATEQQTTILQALGMMNGQFVADATSLERSTTLAAVAAMPSLTTVERLEAFFLAALSRPTRPGELARLVSYVDAGGATNDSRKALGDIFWALLNSSEFLFNR